MKKVKYIIGFIILSLIISLFVYINKINFEKHVEIRNNYVNHPDGLINKDIAKATSFGFANLRADFLWLQIIQYIGGNAISAEYKKYLYAITDVTTQLNPYFEHPYIIAQLLLPGANQRYEDLSEDEMNIHTQEAITLGLKGIKNFCDLDKIELIKNEKNLRNIWSKDEYKNPCKSYKVPYYLAYVYFQYQNDPATASDYYKIASVNDDTVSGAKSMAAIMAGKGGNREKSIFMFLNIADSLDTSEDQRCSLFSKQLTEVSTGIFLAKQLSLNAELIQGIQEIRLENFGSFLENKEEQISDTECLNFLNKANRELNLAYLDQANQQYKIDNNGKNATDGKELLEKGYITFLPTDFQQYEDHGIRYEFNEEIGIFDYNMNY